MPDPPSVQILLSKIPALIATNSVEITPQQKDGGNLSGWSAIGGCATQEPPPVPVGESYGRRELYCTTQVISNPDDELTPEGDGSNTLVLVSCDLHSCTKPLYSAVTDYLHEWYSIPPSNVIVNGTHTHSGPGRFYGNKVRFGEERRTEGWSEGWSEATAIYTSTL